MTAYQDRFSGGPVESPEPDDPEAIGHYFASRDEAVEFVADTILPEGFVFTADEYAYIKKSPGTISDMPGCRPFGDPHAQHYGAAMDGETDDAPAINACWDNHPDCYLGDGTYAVGSTLSRDNRRLIGRGISRTIIRGLSADINADNAVLTPGRSSVLIGFTVEYDALAGTEGRWKRVGLDTRGLSLDLQRGAVIDQVRFRNVGTAVSDYGEGVFSVTFGAIEVGSHSHAALDISGTNRTGNVWGNWYINGGDTYTPAYGIRFEGKEHGGVADQLNVEHQTYTVAPFYGSGLRGLSIATLFFEGIDNTEEDTSVVYLEKSQVKIGTLAFVKTRMTGDGTALIDLGATGVWEPSPAFEDTADQCSLRIGTLTIQGAADPNAAIYTDYPSGREGLHQIDWRLIRSSTTDGKWLVSVDDYVWSAQNGIPEDEFVLKYALERHSDLAGVTVERWDHLGTLPAPGRNFIRNGRFDAIAAQSVTGVTTETEVALNWYVLGATGQLAASVETDDYGQDGGRYFRVSNVGTSGTFQGALTYVDDYLPLLDSPLCVTFEARASVAGQRLHQVQLNLLNPAGTPTSVFREVISGSNAEMAFSTDWQTYRFPVAAISTSGVTLAAGARIRLRFQINDSAADRESQIDIRRVKLERGTVATAFVRNEMDLLPARAARGAITPHDFIDYSYQPNADNSAALLAAITAADARGTRAGAPMKIDLTGLNWGVTNTIAAGARGYYEIDNGTISCLAGSSWSTGQALLDIGGGGSLALTARNIIIRNNFEGNQLGKVAVKVENAGPANKILFNTLHGFKEAHIRALTKSGGLLLKGNFIREYWDNESDGDTQANCTSIGLDIQMPDIVVDDVNIAGCAKQIYKGTGFNCQISGCHLFANPFTGTIDPDAVIGIEIDDPRGLVMSDMYMDKCATIINADILHEVDVSSYACRIDLLNHLARGDNEHEIIIRTTVADNNLRGLSITNSMFPVGADNISFETSGSGSYDTHRRWSWWGNSQRDGTPVSSTDGTLEVLNIHGSAWFGNSADLHLPSEASIDAGVSLDFKIADVTIHQVNDSNFIFGKALGPGSNNALTITWGTQYVFLTPAQNTDAQIYFDNDITVWNSEAPFLIQDRPPALSHFSRAGLVTWLTTHTPKVDTILTDGTLSWKYDGTSTDISDMAGCVPVGTPVPDHFATNTTPGTTDMTTACQAAINYVGTNRLGDCVFPGRYRTTASLVMSTRGVRVTGIPYERTDGTTVSTSIKGAIIADFTTGPVIWCSASECGVDDLSLDASATRLAAASASAGAGGLNCGLLVEPADSPGIALKNFRSRGVLSAKHPGGGIIIEGDVTEAHIHNPVTILNGGHGIAMSSGYLSGRTNKARGGIVNIYGGLAHDNQGHGLALGHPDEGGNIPYRVHTFNHEAYRNALGSSVRYKDACNYRRLENSSAFGGAGAGTDTGNVPTRMAEYVSGRDFTYYHHRFINCNGDCHIEIGTDTGLTTRNIRILGGTAVTTGTCTDFAKVDASAIGVRIDAPFLAGGEDAVDAYTSAGLVVDNGEDVAWYNRIFTVNGDTQYPFIVQRDGNGIGLQVVRTGSGAGTAKIDVSGATINIGSSTANDVVLQRNSTQIGRLTSAGILTGDASLGGAWNTPHLLLGAYHLWVDSTGVLRIKSGAPASDTDGTIVGTQT